MTPLNHCHHEVYDIRVNDNYLYSVGSKLEYAIESLDSVRKRGKKGEVYTLHVNNCRVDGCPNWKGTYDADVVLA